MSAAPLTPETRKRPDEDSGKKPGIEYSPTPSYTPNYLADKILTSRRIIAGERKLVTVLVSKGEFKSAKVHLESAIKYNETAKNITSLPGSYSWLGLACCINSSFLDR